MCFHFPQNGSAPTQFETNHAGKSFLSPEPPPDFPQKGMALCVETAVHGFRGIGGMQCLRAIGGDSTRETGRSEEEWATDVLKE